MRNKGPAHQEYRGQVRAKHVIPLIKGEVRDALPNINARIVDEDLNLAKAARYLPAPDRQHSIRRLRPRGRLRTFPPPPTNVGRYRFEFVRHRADTSATCAPASASAIDIAFPNPFEAPVTSAIRPSSFFSDMMLFASGGFQDIFCNLLRLFDSLNR